MNTRLRVLLVEDSEDDALLLVQALRAGGFDPDWVRVGTGSDLRSALSGREWDIVLCHSAMPQFESDRALGVLREEGQRVPVIVVSGSVCEQIAVESARSSAHDFVLSDNLTRLVPAVRRELREAVLRREKQFAEEQLRESQERLIRSQRIARLGNWEYFAKDDRLWWSDEVFDLFGVPRAQFTGRVEDFLLAIHPEDLEHVWQLFDDSFTRGGISEFEHRIVRPDNGEIRHVLERMELVMDADGKPLRQSGTVQDITDRKRAETESTRIKIAIEYASDAIGIFDAEKRSIFHNRTFIELLGRTPEQLNAAGGVQALFANQGIAEEAFAAVNRDGSWTGDAFLRAQPGRTVELFLRANAVRDAQDQIVAIIIVGTDLSEQKRAERQIAEQAALLDQAQDAIVVRDLWGGVRYWNKSAERLFGWTAEEAIGRKVQEFLYQNTDDYDAGMAGVLRQGDWNREATKLTKSGGEVLVEERARLLRDQFGDPKSILVINTDITERKKLEAQFFRVQRMESIGTLAGGIAHDLNNVLGPIIMAVDLFKLKMTDPRDLELLETVEVSAHRGAEMVQQVLSFARGMEGRRVLVHPARLLQEIEKIAGETFPKSIVMHTRAERGVWNVPGDPTQLHQVLLNLCVNARDAMPAGGCLSISAANQTIDEQFASMHRAAQPGVYVVFSVADTGMGMPPDVLEKIFDPFFTTKEVGRGTGLGLSTTLAIVKSHGGFMNVESALGKGTKFEVFIPADDSGEAAHTVPGLIELPRGNGELILVIDDEASVRGMTGQTLEAFGYRVITAGDGADGIAKYAQNLSSIGAVVTDMMMPVMDGAATIRALMRINPSVLIIAVSGLSTKGVEAEAAGVGVKFFLPKPYTAGTLLTTLRELLRPGAE